MDDNRLPSWLPREQPLQALTIFGIVLLLAAVPIAILSLSDGKDDEAFGGPRTIIDKEPVRPIDPRNGPPVVTVPGPTRPTGPPPVTTPTPTTPTPVTPSPPPTPAPSEPEEKPPVIREIGDKGTDDGIEFWVFDAELKNSVAADRYQRGGRIRAPKGGKLAVVKVRYENHSGVPVDLFCGSGSARAIDQYDRPHEAVDQLYEIPGNEEICSGDEIADGDGDPTTLVFALPRGRTLKSVELYNGKYAPDYDGEASFVRFEVP